MVLKNRRLLEEPPPLLLSLHVMVELLCIRRDNMHFSNKTWHVDELKANVQCGFGKRKRFCTCASYNLMLSLNSMYVQPAKFIHVSVIQYLAGSNMRRSKNCWCEDGDWSSCLTGASDGHKNLHFALLLFHPHEDAAVFLIETSQQQ